jgi:carbamoyl-phosphate synthase/aspartate carbamoyltransferase/dihydroorotase
MILPGLVDIHVHLRTPGGEHKEDFRTGSAAALAGGFTMLLAMPNTQPPLVTLESWQSAQTRAQNESLCDVFLYAGASAEQLNELPALANEAPALKIYMDQTYGPLYVRGLANLMPIFAVWPAAKPICVHAEGESVALAIGLAAMYKKHVHICHVSRKSEIELIAQAKASGLPVTCEVTPHHLFLTQADAARLGPYGDVRPMLGSVEDQEALWQHLITTIDCIASDHAPHTRDEKELIDGSPPGVPGLESTLPLLLTAAAQGRITYARLVELLYTNPRRIFNLPEQADTYVEVDPLAKYTFPEHPLYTKCTWSPFSGMSMTGKVQHVVLRGQEVVRDGLVLNFR